MKQDEKAKSSIRNEKVAGSTPVSGTNKINEL